MKRIINLKDKLLKTNPCPEVWEKKTGRYPDSEVGYIRAYYDGYSWVCNSFPITNNFVESELVEELSVLFDAFTRSFKTAAAMSKWCLKNAEPTNDPTEFNAWYVGEKGIYWFRMIARRGDYNLYLHCLDRNQIKEVENNANS